MASVRNGSTHGTSDTAHAKKRKGFWSNLLGRSSNATDTHESKGDERPESKGFMGSLIDDAGQVATKVTMNVAEAEATKEIKARLNSSNESQPTDASTTNMAPDSSTASDALSASTNWAKRMVDSAQQKVQNLQNLASS